MKIKFAAAGILALLLLTGCAIIQPVKPQQALTNPLGTDSLKIGMTKDKVKSLLGEPDAIVPQDRSTDMLSTEREQWIYHGRYSGLPLKADYFGKALELNFEGNNLTSYKSD